MESNYWYETSLFTSYESLYLEARWFIKWNESEEDKELTGKLPQPICYRHTWGKIQALL